MEIYNLNLLFWCIHFDLLTLIWKINVWNNSLLIYRRKNKLLFPCLYSDQPSLCHVSVRLEKTKCITCKRHQRIFHSQFNCDWGLRQIWMIPSCFLWKVAIYFGKEHVNWSSISGVMRGRSWKIEFGKLKIGVLAL